MALVTKAEVKRRLAGFDATDTASDTLLDELIAAADEAIAIHLGYPPATAGTPPTLESATHTRYYGGDPRHFALLDSGLPDQTILQLDVLPVSSVTSISEDTEWSYSDTIDSGDYVLEGDTGRVYLTPTSTHGSFAAVRRALKVIFVAGWSTVPDAIKTAAIETIATWWDLPERRGRGSVSAGGQTTTYRDERLPDSARELLAPFILPRAMA